MDAGVITATIPQSCFGTLAGTDRGAVKVTASTQGDVGSQGRSDSTVQARLLGRTSSAD